MAPVREQKAKERTRKDLSRLASILTQAAQQGANEPNTPAIVHATRACASTWGGGPCRWSRRTS
jgi:hypothetical protein